MGSPTYVTMHGSCYVVGPTGVGRHAGVTTRQASAWYQRRDANGFPECVASALPGRRSRLPRQLFDVDELDAWLDAYRLINPGFRPPGWRPRGHWVRNEEDA